MDKEILETLLSLSKSIIKLYSDASIESSNKKVSSAMSDGLNKTLGLQQELYGQMSEDCFYQVQNVNQSEITKTLKKLTQDK